MSQPNVDLFIYPWVTSNILFICSSGVYWNETSWHCYVLSVVLWTMMPRTCLLSLAGDRPEPQSVQGTSTGCVLCIRRSSLVAAQPTLVMRFSPLCRLDACRDNLHVGVMACHVHLRFHRHTSFPHTLQGNVCMKQGGNSMLSRLHKRLARRGKAPQSAVLFMLTI